jgi:diguanylate cyclase (GGDEF)-like protein
MTRDKLEVGHRFRVEAAQIVLLGTGGGVALSILLNYLLFFSEALTPFERGLVTAIVVPIAVGAPLSLVLAYYMREVGRYRRALTHFAAYDPTTAVFKRNAFSSVVDRRIPRGSREGERQGAFLVVNAENLRSINLRYGLDWGEEALRFTASTIRSSVRAEDIVGQLGPSEFGIFLPGATEDNAREVGQRIRDGVADAFVMPAHSSSASETDLLSVSVGGVIFENELGFDRMYHAAEQQLSNAERSGVIEIVRIADNSSTTQTGQTAH